MADRSPGAVAAVVIGTAGGVLSALILAIWPASDIAVGIRNAAGAVGGAVWPIVAYLVSVPLWLLACFALALAVLWRRKSRRAGAAPIAQSLSPELLEPDELSIMKALRAIEGLPLYVEAAREALRIGRLEMGRAVDRLSERDFVGLEQSARGPTLQVPRKGRDFLIDHRVTSDGELAAALAKEYQEKVVGVGSLSDEEVRTLVAHPRRRNKAAAMYDIDEVGESALLFVSANEGTVAVEVAAHLHIGEQLALHHLEKLKAAELVWDNYTAGSDWGDPSRHEWTTTANGRAHLARRNLLK